VNTRPTIHAIASLLLATASQSAVAQQPTGGGHQHTMPGMAAIKIPAGANITEADVRFMQGM